MKYRIHKIKKENEIFSHSQQLTSKEIFWLKENFLKSDFEIKNKINYNGKQIQKLYFLVTMSI